MKQTLLLFTKIFVKIKYIEIKKNSTTFKSSIILNIIKKTYTIVFPTNYLINKKDCLSEIFSILIMVILYSFILYFITDYSFTYIEFSSMYFFVMIFLVVYLFYRGIKCIYRYRGYIFFVITEKEYNNFIVDFIIIVVTNFMCSMYVSLNHNDLMSNINSVYITDFLPAIISFTIFIIYLKLHRIFKNLFLIPINKDNCFVSNMGKVVLIMLSSFIISLSNLVYLVVIMQIFH